MASPWSPRPSLSGGRPRYSAPIDWALFRLLNGSLRDRPAIADWIEDYVTFWAVPLFVVATFSLWILDRPGQANRWKVACLSGLVSAGLGLAVGQVVSHIWVRERPFDAHPLQTVLFVPGSSEPSFPSDHATAAFAIAFSVLLVGRRLGLVFVLAAVTIGMGRIFVGVHYPGDIAAGAFIGLLASLRGVARWMWSLESHRRRRESPDRSGRRATVEGSRRHPYSGSPTQSAIAAGRCSANEAERGQRLTMFCTS